MDPNVMRFTLHRKPGIPRLGYVRLGASADSCDQAPSLRPVEGRPRIGFAARGDIAMADQSIRRQSRIRCAERGDHLGKRMVLRGLVGKRIGALEFDADRKIVACRAALETGLARVPRSLRELDILRDRAGAFDRHVGRYA